MSVQVAQRCRPREGEDECGDALVVQTQSNGLLVAAIDGLGHGKLASVAAQRAAQFVEEHTDHSLPDLLGGLHRALRGTRGAAVTLCRIVGDELEAVGIGNVNLRTERTRVPSILSPGIVGLRHHKLHPARVQLRLPERLILFTDGLSATLELGQARQMGTEAALDTLFDRYASTTDDASAVVVDIAEDL